MSEWGKPAKHRATPLIEMPYLRDRDEREYVLILENWRRYIDDGRALCSTMLAYCSLSAPSDCLLFSPWSMAQCYPI